MTIFFKNIVIILIIPPLQFELCSALCRTSSLSVRHENKYRDEHAKHCFVHDEAGVWPAWTTVSIVWLDGPLTRLNYRTPLVQIDGRLIRRGTSLNYSIPSSR